MSEVLRQKVACCASEIELSMTHALDFDALETSIKKLRAAIHELKDWHDEQEPTNA